MEVTLQEVLDAREKRAEKQKELLQKHEKTLVCFTMNIAGPVKYSPLIAQGFRMGCQALSDQLGDRVLYSQKLPRHTGCEAFFVADMPAEQVKRITTAIEEATPLGRLFDMDVFAPDGTRLQRQRERTCLLCGKSAKVCGRSRAHSVEALQQKTNAILREALQQERSRQIAARAVKALLYEVCTAPKPGLVDRLGSGSHRDMDIYTFMGSAAVLQPYFADCAGAGMDTAEKPAEATFARLRFLGKAAEQTMLAETGGVNTHKGAIFTMGLLCGAAGRLENSQPEAILAEVAAMCRGLTDRDLGGITKETAKTAGQRLYADHGITGIRGQAEQGYPAVLHTGLPVLEEGLAMGLSPERSGCAALLAMLTATQDTNLITRGGLERTRALTREIALLLAKNRYPDMEQLTALDDLFTEENLSPGGTADLLAACWFLHFMR